MPVYLALACSGGQHFFDGEGDAGVNREVLALSVPLRMLGDQSAAPRNRKRSWNT